MLPLVLAASRLVLGAAALVFALDGVNLFLAATLIVIAFVIDGAGHWLGVRNPDTGEPAVPFDDLTDYLTLVVAPWLLIQSMLVGSRSPAQELLLDLPLVVGALRATGALWRSRRGRERRGLSTGFYALTAVAAVFLHLPALMAPRQLTVILSASAAVLSILMLAPLRYPTPQHWRLAPVLAFLAVMPFVASEILVSVALIAAAVYILAGPFFSGKRRNATMAASA